MSKARKLAMSIAGFDPSGGAGVLADVKTFEQLKVYAFGVLTANTFQDDASVKRVDWMTTTDIIAQIDVVLDKFAVFWFKIGIVENSEALEAIAAHIKSRVPAAKITWDPVLKSSSGFPFFAEKQPGTLPGLVDIITPNLPEFETLIGSEERALEQSHRQMIYLKGGHRDDHPGKDTLFWNGKKYPLNPRTGGVTPKHGSGCVFSSALCAHLALGNPVIRACLKSKRYVEKVLSSNPTLLGWHHN